MKNALSLRWRGTVLSDSDLLFEWRRRPHIAEFLYSDHDISREEHETWLPRALADPRRVYWTVLSEDRPVGLANLADIDSKNQRCAWAFYIGEIEFTGRGVGSWIETQVLHEVFNVRGLNKLTCEVLSHNVAARAIHKKFGFREEGLLKQHVLKRGVRHDVILLALLRDEYLEQDTRHARDGTSVLATARDEKSR
jgi:UDP-4-amino-4,6-dideoxy-N-acetyl-beta-L-altrosamine N-acetyltransferase